jgi:nucleoside phosphorylase
VSSRLEKTIETEPISIVDPQEIVEMLKTKSQESQGMMGMFIVFEKAQQTQSENSPANPVLVDNSPKTSDAGPSSLKEKITLSNKIWEGPIITCQAMMGETWEDVQSWSKEGYHGVEMETSTVFSVSNSFKVPSASIMYISDNLIKGQTVGDDSHVAQKDIRELSKNEVYKVGILTLLN